MRGEKVIELGEESHTNGLFTPISKQGEMIMLIGIPKEIKNNENRVGLTLSLIHICHALLKSPSRAQSYDHTQLLAHAPCLQK